MNYDEYKVSYSNVDLAQQMLKERREKLRNEGRDINHPATKQLYSHETELLKKAKETYSRQVQEMVNKFEHDLAIEHGVVDHPKRNLLFSKAYERGHSSGYPEIASVYEDLVELL